MIGTKLLLISFVVYASGQDVTYYGGSNVRTQGRLPPRSRPLGPYRPAYTPNAEPIRPVYQPVYQTTQPDQLILEPQPGYQQPQPDQLEFQTNQPPYELQPDYLPPQPIEPAVPRPLSPERRPASLGPPIYVPEPSIPAPVAPDTSPQPIFIPQQSALPVQPSTQPINSYPRPLPPWSWKPVQPTETPAEAITAPPSYYPKTVDAESPMDNRPELAPVQEPTVVLLPEAEETASSSTPEDSLPVIEVNPQPDPVPGLSTPEPLPEHTPTLKPELRPIPEEPFTDPISDTEPPIMNPNPLIPIDIPQTDDQPYILPESHPNLGLLPSQPRPVPRPGPNIPEPQQMIPEPAIPSKPVPMVTESNNQPMEPLAPVDSAPLYLPSRPIQPMQTSRPNYQPIPPAPVPRPLPLPQSPSPNYRPLVPPTPASPILANPGTQRPLPPPPLTSRPTYEHPTPYPTLAPNPTPEPSQSTPEPTPYYPITPSTPSGPSSQPEILPITPMTGFQCKGNGYYTIINECDAYIECQSQRAYKHYCPDGLHFNPEALYPEYPCAYPSEVQCVSTASKQNAQPTNECPNRYGFFSISGGDCSKYIMCQEGKATLMNCPYGLVFNVQLSSCDWPENVPQCNPNVFKDFNCPMPPEDDPDLLTRYRHGSDCRMYVACQHGHPRLLRCDIGMSFDNNSQVCIDSELVAECKIPSSFL